MAETQNKAPQSEKGQERRSRVEPFQDQQQKREMVFVPYEGFVGSLGAKDTLKRAKDPTTETQVSRKDGTSEFYDSLLGTSMINPETERHVAVLSDQRFSHPANSEPSSRIVNRMQQTYGNGYVQRVVDIVQENRADDLSEDVVSDDIEQRIHSKRGSGQPLENQTRRQMDNAFGHDFSNVNIHTDGSADSLAQALQAKAFTVGNDVFFREGAYQPDSESGKKLLGHELTHVIQQTPQASLNAILQRTCDEACRRRAGVLVGQMHTLFGNTQITDAVRRQAYSTFGADEMNADLAGEIVRQYDSHWGQPGFVADFMSFVRRVAEQSQRHPGQTVEEATNQLVEIWAADFYDAGITEIQQQYPIPRTIPFTQANLNRWRTQLVPSRYSGSGAGSQLNIAPLVMWISGFRWQTLQGGYEWIQRLGWMPSFNSATLLPCIQMISAQPELNSGGIRETDAYFTEIWSRYTNALDDGGGENGRGTRNMIASYQIHRDYARANVGQLRPVSAALAQKIEDWYHIYSQGGRVLPETRDVAKPVNQWVPAWHQLLGRWRANQSIDQGLRQRAGIATPTGNNPMLQIPGTREFFGG